VVLTIDQLRAKRQAEIGIEADKRAEEGENHWSVFQGLTAKMEQDLALHQKIIKQEARVKANTQTGSIAEQNAVPGGARKLAPDKFADDAPRLRGKSDRNPNQRGRAATKAAKQWPTKGAGLKSVPE